MKTFKYVEEYLEVIGGHLDPVTGKKVTTWFFQFQPIINLARYDVKVLESMTTAVVEGRALTQRQADLACKMVLNYRRQLAAKGVDVTPVELPQWRVPLRTMDYSQRITLDSDVLNIRFPYNQGLINDLREFGKGSQGTVRWNPELKMWQAAVTEYNVSWVSAWAQLNRIELDPAVAELMNLITALEQQEYRIELTVAGDRLTVTNATDSLRDYIEQHLGGFDLDNVLRLVDMSAVLGYTVSEDIYQVVQQAHGMRFYTLATARELKINTNIQVADNDLDSVLDYADTVGRWPVVIYEPDLSRRMLTRLVERYGADFDRTRYIHIEKPADILRSQVQSIPLLISSAGMVFGGDKQAMIQMAEKIVYTASEVYNSKKQTVRKVPTLAG
jgi:hypothetical protein